MICRLGGWWCLLKLVLTFMNNGSLSMMVKKMCTREYVCDQRTKIWTAAELIIYPGAKCSTGDGIFTNFPQ